MYYFILLMILLVPHLILSSMKNEKNYIPDISYACFYSPDQIVGAEKLETISSFYIPGGSPSPFHHRIIFLSSARICNLIDIFETNKKDFENFQHPLITSYLFKGNNYKSKTKFVAESASLSLNDQNKIIQLLISYLKEAEHVVTIDSLLHYLHEQHHNLKTLQAEYHYNLIAISFIFPLLAPSRKKVDGALEKFNTPYFAKHFPQAVSAVKMASLAWLCHLNMSVQKMKTADSISCPLDPAVLHLEQSKELLLFNSNKKDYSSLPYFIPKELIYYIIQLKRSLGLFMREITDIYFKTLSNYEVLKRTAESIWYYHEQYVGK